VVQTYGTDEFGIVDAALTSGTQPTPFQYTGEPRDSETGLVYLRARSYDPTVGRFMQADPLRKSAPGVGGWNRYAYVGNNPIRLTDPSGLCVNSVCQSPQSNANTGSLWRIGSRRIFTSPAADLGQQQAAQVAATDCSVFGTLGQAGPEAILACNIVTKGSAVVVVVGSAAVAAVVLFKDDIANRLDVALNAIRIYDPRTGAYVDTDEPRATSSGTEAVLPGPPPGSSPQAPQPGPDLQSKLAYVLYAAARIIDRIHGGTERPF